MKCFINIRLIVNVLMQKFRRTRPFTTSTKAIKKQSSLTLIWSCCKPIVIICSDCETLSLYPSAEGDFMNIQWAIIPEDNYRDTCN